MKITELQVNLVLITQDLKSKWLKDEYDINAIYEFNYEHDIEIEIESKKCDFNLILKFNKDFNFIAYEVKGRDIYNDSEIASTYYHIINYIEDYFTNVKSLLKETADRGINRRNLHCIGGEN